MACEIFWRDIGIDIEVTRGIREMYQAATKEGILIELLYNEVIENAIIILSLLETNCNGCQISSPPECKNGEVDDLPSPTFGVVIFHTTCDRLRNSYINKLSSRKKKKIHLSIRVSQILQHDVRTKSRRPARKP